MEESSTLKSPIEIGSRIGDYVITQRLGAGGMCEVFKGIDPMLERYVAVKVMLKELQTPEILADFLEEARVIARMMHSNIVPLYSVGQIEGIPWLAMGFIEGPNLEMFLKEYGPFSLEEAEKFLRQSCSALAYAAKSNVIHLDIKPANFILDPQGEFLLADFGVARRISDIKSGALDNQELLGTPSYASPEHITQSKPDLRTDIYCLGVTLFELLVGDLPYVADDVVEVCRMHLFKPFPVEILEQHNIPQGWCNVLRKMMEKKPEDRFQTYADIMKALDSIDHFTGVKMVTEVVTPQGRYYLPRTGGNPEDLFYLLPHDLVTKGQDIYRLGQPYTAAGVFDTMTSRWPVLHINTLAERLLHLQAPKDEDVDDTLWALARIKNFESTIDCLSEFMATQEGTEIKTQDEKLELVGLDRARNLAIVSRAFYSEDWQAERPLNHHNFLEHAIYTGILAGFMADMLSLPTLGLEFAVGFLSNLGRLILMEMYPSKTVAVWLKAYEKCQPLEEIESDLFGLTNYEVAAEWLRRQKFSKVIYGVTKSQLEPENSYSIVQECTSTMRLLSSGPSYNKNNIESLAYVTSCANTLAKELGFGFTGSPALEETPWIEQERTKALFAKNENEDVTFDQFKQFFTETCKSLPELHLTQLALAEHSLKKRKPASAASPESQMDIKNKRISH